MGINNQLQQWYQRTFSIIKRVECWYMMGTHKLKELFYIKIINYVNTFFLNIDRREILPRSEGFSMVYAPIWYWKQYCHQNLYPASIENGRFLFVKPMMLQIEIWSSPTLVYETLHSKVKLFFSQNSTYYSCTIKEG
jgi:hypothetical protein